MKVTQSPSKQAKLDSFFGARPGAASKPQTVPVQAQGHKRMKPGFQRQPEPPSLTTKSSNSLTTKSVPKAAGTGSTVPPTASLTTRSPAKTNPPAGVRTSPTRSPPRPQSKLNQEENLTDFLLATKSVPKPTQTSPLKPTNQAAKTSPTKAPSPPKPGAKPAVSKPADPKAATKPPTGPPKISPTKTSPTKAPSPKPAVSKPTNPQTKTTPVNKPTNGPSKPIQTTLTKGPAPVASPVKSTNKTPVKSETPKKGTKTPREKGSPGSDSPKPPKKKAKVLAPENSLIPIKKTEFRTSSSYSSLISAFDSDLEEFRKNSVSSKTPEKAYKRMTPEARPKAEQDREKMMAQLKELKKNRKRKREEEEEEDRDRDVPEDLSFPEQLFIPNYEEIDAFEMEEEVAEQPEEAPESMSED